MKHGMNEHQQPRQPWILTLRGKDTSPFRSEPIEWVTSGCGGVEKSKQSTFSPEFKVWILWAELAELIESRPHTTVTAPAKLVNGLGAFRSLSHTLFLQLPGSVIFFCFLSLSAFLFLKCQNLYAHGYDPLVPKPLKRSFMCGSSTPQASFFNYSRRTS